MPPLTSAEATFFAAFDTAAARWKEINHLASGAVPGFTPPLTLRGGTTLAQFENAVATVRQSQQGRADHAEAADSLQARRDSHVAPLRKKMTAYRDAVLYHYGDDSPHTDTLPTQE